MADTIPCPHCGNRYRLQSELAGKKVKCRQCGQSFEVPAGPASGPRAPPPLPPSHTGSSGQTELPKTVPSLEIGSPFATEDPFAVQAPIIHNPLEGWRRRQAWLRRLKIGGLAACVVGVLGGIVVGVVFLVKAVSENWSSVGAIPGESFAQEVLRVTNELVDIVASIKDVNSARAAVPRIKAIRPRFENLARQFEEVKKIQLTAEQDRELKRRYEAQLDAVVERMKKEVARLQTLPGVLEALADPELAALGSSVGPFRFPGIIPPPMAPPGLTPFGVPAPAPASPSPPPEDEVAKLTRECGPDRILTVTVEGIPAGQNSFVRAKVREAAGGRTAARTPSSGTMVITVGPVGDVQAVARRLDLGEVTQVDPAGRRVSVKADPSKFPEPIRAEATNPAHADFVKANLVELKCPDPDRRGQAASRLRSASSKQDREDVAKALLGLMGNNDPVARREAMGAWAAWQTPATTAEAVALLFKLIRDEDHLVRAAAWQALSSVKNDQTAAAVAKLLEDPSLRTDAANCLARMGAAAEKPLLELLEHADKDVRREAASALVQVATSQSTDVLIGYLEGSDPELAKRSLQVLARLKDPKAIEPLARQLANKELAAAAARALIEIGPSAEKAVIAAAEKNRDAMAGAMTVLDKIGTEACAPLVIQIAAGNDFNASRQAFRFLERTKDERAIVPMVELLSSFHHRHAASEVLKAIGPPAEDALLKGLKFRDPVAVQACLEILREIGTKKSLRSLKAFRSRDGWTLECARRAYGAIAARAGFAQGGFDTDSGTEPSGPEPGDKDPLMKGGFNTGPEEKGGQQKVNVVE